MQKAIVLSCTPNGMPTRSIDPNLRPGDIDLNRTFNAMRETQRKGRDVMQLLCSTMANSHVGWGNSAQAQASAASIGMHSASMQNQQAWMLGALGESRNY